MSQFRSRTYYTADARTVEVQQPRAAALGLRLAYNRVTGYVDIYRGQERLKDLVTGVELAAFLTGYKLGCGGNNGQETTAVG